MRRVRHDFTKNGSVLAAACCAVYPKNMQDEVRALLILQDRDRRLLAIAKDLAKLPKDQERARDKLKGDQAHLAQAQHALKEAELRVKKIELDAETRRTTIKRLKNQQFETRKNDEFQALAHEITRYEQDVDAYETRELEAMVEADAFREAVHIAEKQLSTTEAQVKEELARLQQRHQILLDQQREVEVDRATCAQAVPSEILPLYQKLMKSKDGLAVVALKDQLCDGCHMKVVAGTMIKVQTAKEITQCENCGRILYQD